MNDRKVDDAFRSGPEWKHNRFAPILRALPRFYIFTCFSNIKQEIEEILPFILHMGYGI